MKKEFLNVKSATNRHISPPHYTKNVKVTSWNLALKHSRVNQKPCFGEHVAQQCV